MSRRIMVEILGDERQLVKAFGRSEKSAESFGLTMKSVARTTGGFSRGFLSGAGALSSFGGALALTSGAFFAGAGLVAGLKAAVREAGTFQQTLNVLQQVSGATAAQMASASREARRLGADISLPATSASDAATAMLQLAKGGLTIKQAMEAARGTLELAAAAQTDVGTAANTTARTLTAFGLSGKEAGKVADALANAANAATGDINDFALGLSQSSATAHQFGLTAQDTVAALTVLARAGLVGSDAGTSLRVMLSRLEPTAGKAAREVKKLGLSVTDATGHFLPFRDIVEKYNAVLTRLTPAQKQYALQVIFGTDAQRSANIIFGHSVKAYDQASKAVARVGGAAKTAAAQQKGFKGAVDGFNSALQTTEVTVGSTLLPTLTKYLRQSAAWLGDSKNQARVQKDVQKAVNFTVGAIKGLIGSVKFVTGFVGGFKNALKLLIAVKLGSTAFRWAQDIGGFASAVKKLNEASILTSTRNLEGLSKAEKKVVDEAIAANPKLVTMLGTLRKLARNWTLALAIKFPKLSGPLAAILGLSTAAKFGAAGTAALVLSAKNAAGGPSSEPQSLSAKQALKEFGKLTGPERREIVQSVKDMGVHLADTVGQAMNDPAFRRAFTQQLISHGFIGNQGIPINEPNPRPIPKLPSSPGSGGAAGAAPAPRGLTPDQRNKFFDNSIARILLRGGLGDIQQQIAALQRANALIAARLKVTKDVTRKLNLEDEILQNAAQIRSLREQQTKDALQKRQDQANEMIAALQLGVTKAQATGSFKDDLSALRALEGGIRSEIREFGKTADLASQLFDVQQQIIDTVTKQRDARQFFALGLGPTGDTRIPLVKTLKKEFANVSAAVQGSFLDTNKTRSVLAGIKKVLSGGLGSISTEVRAKIKELLDGIDQQLKQHAQNQTRFAHLNSLAFVNALGLNLTPEQKRRIGAVFSTVSANGAAPGRGSRAFAAAGADIVVHTNVNLDGATVARNTTRHQQSAGRRRSSSRRGPYAGNH